MFVHQQSPPRSVASVTSKEWSAAAMWLRFHFIMLTPAIYLAAVQAHGEMFWLVCVSVHILRVTRWHLGGGGAVVASRCGGCGAQGRE